MGVTILCAGTRGDVEPFAALAREACRRGHLVRLAVSSTSGADLRGLDAVSLRVDYRAFVAEQGVSPLAALRALRTTVRP